MKVLITGAAGRLGRKVARQFLQNGDLLRVLDVRQNAGDGGESLEAIEILKGDVRDPETARRAVFGVDTIVHLAALTPPASERCSGLTMEVAVGGTENVLRAAEGSGARVILASSVAVFGDTTRAKPPVAVDHPLSALDGYGRSSIESEQATRTSRVPFSILRIAPIATPAVVAPPGVWPFQAVQRVELVSLDDVAAAVFASAHEPTVRGKTLVVAGGPSWQTIGRQYVASLHSAMHADVEEPIFSDSPGNLDWYDTTESQVLLRYQNTSFPRFLAGLRHAAQESLTEARVQVSAAR